MVLFISEVANAEEGDWDLYPKHIRHCLEAINSHMGEEKKYAEIILAQEFGNVDCKISAIFVSNENIKKFNEVRINNGQDPDVIKYDKYTIEIVKNIGDMEPH